MKRMNLFLLMIATVLLVSCGNDGKRTMTTTKKFVYKQSAFETQMQQTHLLIADRTGRLLSHIERDTVFAKNLESFKRLYFGRAKAFADVKVVSQMTDVLEKAERYKSGKDTNASLIVSGEQITNLIRQSFVSVSVDTVKFE